MEDVLAVYTRPRDADYPLVCLDEKVFYTVPSRLIGHQLRVR